MSNRGTERHRRRNGYPRHLRKLLAEAVREEGASDSRPWKVADFGVDGATATCCGEAYFLKSAFREALQLGADVYVVLLGTNDAKASVWQEERFERDYLAIVGHLLLGSARERPPALLLVLPPPLAAESTLGVQRRVVNDRLPKLLVELAGQAKLDVVDAFGGLGGPEPPEPSELHREDGCHLSDQGDRLLAGLVRDALLRLERSPPDAAAAAAAVKTALLRRTARPGGPAPRRRLDELAGRTAAALLRYGGEGLRLVGYCNKWKFRDSAYCFLRVPPRELCTGSGPGGEPQGFEVAPAEGAWRHQLTLVLQEGCLSFQVIGAEQLFSFRIFPADVGEDGFFRLARGSPSAVRAVVGGEADGHGCNFFIEEAPGTAVTVYVELLESPAVMLLSSGREEAVGAGGTAHAAAVWYVPERRGEKLLRPLQVSQQPGRQAPKHAQSHTHKFDTYYRHLMAKGQDHASELRAAKQELQTRTAASLEALKMR